MESTWLQAFSSGGSEIFLQYRFSYCRVKLASLHNRVPLCRVNPASLHNRDSLFRVGAITHQNKTSPRIFGQGRCIRSGPVWLGEVAGFNRADGIRDTPISLAKAAGVTLFCAGFL